MSFREKSAWICLIATAAVFVPYFVFAFGALSRDTSGAAAPLVPALFAAVFVHAVVVGAAHALAALRQRSEPRDERDDAIDARATRNAYIVLIVAIGVLLFTPVPFEELRTVAIFTQGVLLGFVGAEATRFLSQVVGYRRAS